MITGTHKENVLQFSGGKDSLATLYYLRPYWEQITVLWMNTGSAFPETLDQIAEIKRLVPHFMEVQSNQPKSIHENGWPVDILPLHYSPFGHSIDNSERIKLVSWEQCCFHNKLGPMHEASKSFSVIIRGQRKADVPRSPLNSGDIMDGIKLLFPIEDWSDADVMSYLNEIGVKIPDYYAMTDKSLDCWNCTAFLHETGRIRWMKQKYPEHHEYLKIHLKEIKKAIDSEMTYLDEALDV